MNFHEIQDKAVRGPRAAASRKGTSEMFGLAQSDPEHLKRIVRVDDEIRRRRWADAAAGGCRAAAAFRNLAPFYVSHQLVRRDHLDLYCRTVIIHMWFTACCALK